MENPTKITARVKTTFKVGEDYVHIEIEVADQVRSVDANTSAAIDRVYGLVEEKVAEKAQRYIDKA